MTLFFILNPKRYMHRGPVVIGKFVEDKRETKELRQVKRKLFKVQKRKDKHLKEFRKLEGELRRSAYLADLEDLERLRSELVLLSIQMREEEDEILMLIFLL